MKRVGRGSGGGAGGTAGAAVLVLVLVLAGCGGPAAPPPTQVEVAVVVGPDANPGPDGKGAPVLVRVYQLGSGAGFSGAEFFPLYNQDAATLGTDLVKKDQFLLTPGQTKTLTLMPKDEVQAIGVFAAWRDFQHATWHATTDLGAHKLNKVAVAIGRDGVSVKNEQQPIPKPPA